MQPVFEPVPPAFFGGHALVLPWRGMVRQQTQQEEC